MAIPVATRLVVQALREEAESFRDPWNPDVQSGIRRALDSVADRVEASGSSVHPRTPTSDPDAAAVSEEGHDPARTDKGHPGPEVVVTHPGALTATLKELKRQLDDIGVTSVYPRIGQLVDDCIKLSS